MAVSMDLIKRVVVQGSAEGLDKLESDLRKIAATTDGVSVSFEKASRSQLSAQTAYNRLASSIDPAEKAQQQITKGVAVLDRALQQGIISVESYAQRISQLREKYSAGVSANDNYIRSLRQFQQLVNEFANVKTDFGTDNRRADIEAYGKALDELRAKHNPLFAVQKQFKESLEEINQAAKVGAIDEKERIAAINSAQGVYAKQIKDLAQYSNSTKSARYEIINLSRQIQDVGVSLYSGQAFTTVLIQQGSQIFDVFASSSEGAKGLFNQLVSGAARFIFSIKGVLAGIAGIGAAALVSAAQWESSQNQIRRSLFGVGRASGATPGAINSIADQSASTFGLSVSEARNLATELAATGKIGVSAIGDIVKLGHDVATVLGVDSAEAAKILAAAFADPVKGAEQLNAKLGFLNARMQQEISDLVAQNRLYEAQQKLAEALKASLDGVGSVVGTVGKGWTAVGNTVSNIWNRLGESVAKGLGIADEDTKQRIENIKKEIDASQKLADLYEGTYAGTQALDNIKALQQELAKLTQDQDKYNESIKRQQANQQSLILKGSINSAAPDIEELKKLQNAYALFDNQLKEVNATGGINSGILDALAISYEKLKRIVDEARGKVEGFKDANARALESVQIQTAAVTAKTPAAKGDIAYRQSLSQSGSTSDTAIKLAEANRLLAIKQATEQITEAQKSRLLSAQQSVETAQTELNVLGKSVAEQESIKGKLQARQQLEQDALQTLGDKDAYDRKHLAALEAEIDKQAKLKQLLAEQQLLRDVKFETSTLGLTETDQNIASRLRGVYGDQWQSQMNGAIASQIRFNEAVKTSQQLGSEFATSFVNDIRNGSNSIDALNSALKRLSDRLTELVLNRSINSLFANLAKLAIGGGGVDLSTAGVGAEGPALGNFVVGVGHTGGVIGSLTESRYVHPAYFDNAPRFHSGGIAGDEMPIIARRGEGIFTPTQMAAMGGGTQVNVSVVNNTNSKVSVQKNQNASGGADIQVLVEQLEDRMASNVAQGRGPLNSALGSRYGLQPRFT